ncbi:hypothetical protein CAP48_15835 [Advenella sp. S44]|uniref:hypothetical protein n=1 Tax=Advenella sp. S44 TaxID=1982755 RepID=UPI000C2AF936|nr:hypothetical protein [Advenella sp. S44]PJX22374.1 hypothetical protein CAP48_15835 [Advenella sp. S44]
MISQNTTQDDAADALGKAESTADDLFDSSKTEMKRKAAQAAGDASYAVNSIFSSIEDSTRRSPGCALLVAGLIGMCIGKHFYKKP